MVMKGQGPLASILASMFFLEAAGGCLQDLFLPGGRPSVMEAGGFVFAERGLARMGIEMR